jgi:hypothetical protein
MKKLRMMVNQALVVLGVVNLWIPEIPVTVMSWYVYIGKCNYYGRK